MSRTFRMVIGAYALLAAAALAACDGTGNRDGSTDGDADADTDADSDSDSDSDTGTDDGCSEESEFVYVVDLDTKLYRFDPEALPSEAFELVGTIDCPTLGSPYALGMTRNDVVYVHYTGGADVCQIWEVSILDATCIGETGFVCDDPVFQMFGMGSATGGPDSSEDTLYIGSSTRLASLDTTTWEITQIGPVENTPDMSGNGNGDLFAFFAWTDPPRVSRFDKADATEHDTVELPQLSGVGAFAFATWGGDGWIFDDAGSPSTNVYRLHDGVLTTHIEDSGLTIVGADTSTCAPYVIE